MSWIENIKDNLVITCGDGKQYSPQWMDASFVRDYNIAEFNFPNIAGTLVDRRMPLGRKYNLHIFFQGEDNRDTSDAFLNSADDPRPWTISHPMYGSITVQPTSLQVDRSKLNVSEISGPVLETILTDNPKSTVVPQDKIAADKEALDGATAESFKAAATSAPLSVQDTNTMAANTAVYQADAAKQVTDTVESENLLNLYNDAQSAIIGATTDPLIAVQKLQAFLNYPPSLLSSSVSTRLQLLGNNFTKLSGSLDTIITRNAKMVYETNAGNLINNMAIAAAFPQTGNYGNRNQVLAVITTVINTYNAFLVNLDRLQSANGGGPTSYIPDANSITRLNDLMNYTISNLFRIALNSKQERIIYLENDSNAVLLTHRFYGLDPDDVNMQYFIASNEIGLNELLVIRKGRRIVYYV